MDTLQTDSLLALQVSAGFLAALVARRGGSLAVQVVASLLVLTVLMTGTLLSSPQARQQVVDIVQTLSGLGPAILLTAVASTAGGFCSEIREFFPGSWVICLKTGEVSGRDVRICMYLCVDLLTGASYYPPPVRIPAWQQCEYAL